MTTSRNISGRKKEGDNQTAAVSVVHQYAETVLDFSSQYGSDCSMSYSALNLAGRPNIYPGYGDFTLAFELRTYGLWWEEAPCAPRPFKERRHHKYASQDFIELKFEKKVYPLKIEIFETFNPGAVVKILACDPVTFRWEVLWSGEPQLIPYTEAQIFAPPLGKTNLCTDLYRIEFCHRHLEYYAELDAVLLKGLLHAPDPPICMQSSSATFIAQSHPPDQAGLNVICNRMETLSLVIVPSLKLAPFHQAFSPIPETKDRINPFERLPTEVIQLIVKNLDLCSLCRMACTCRLMQKQCYDPLLFTEVDLQPYWYKVTNDTLLGLESRCTNMQRLSLSWCGNYGRLTSAAVIDFLRKCSAGNLTCLRLANCKFVVDDVLKTLGDVVPNLEELDLQCCQQTQLTQSGFQQIGRLSKLKRLNLYRTLIDLPSFLCILRGCPLLEVLNLGSCIAISNFDDVAIEIACCCRNLRGLDLWRAKTLTAIGVRAIAESCPNLEEIDLGWCTEVSSSTGCIIDLAQKCSNLRKIFLTALRTVCDNDILAIAKFCTRLEQLDILGTREVTTISLPRLFTQCPRLRFLDLSFCGQIDLVTYRQWQQTFPRMSIKKTYQT